VNGDQSPRRNPRHRTHERAVRRLQRAEQAQTAPRGEAEADACREREDCGEERCGGSREHEQPLGA